jgi:GAF domain-containing protein
LLISGGRTYKYTHYTRLLHCFTLHYTPLHRNGNGKLDMDEYSSLLRVLSHGDVRFKVPRGGFHDFVISTGQTLVVNDVATHPRRNETVYELTPVVNAMLAPIKDQENRIVGLIEVCSRCIACVCVYILTISLLTK